MERKMMKRWMRSTGGVMRRFLAFALVFAMTLTSVNVSVWAAENAESQEATEVNEEMENASDETQSMDSDLSDASDALLTGVVALNDSDSSSDEKQAHIFGKEEAMALLEAQMSGSDGEENEVSVSGKTDEADVSDESNGNDDTEVIEVTAPAASSGETITGSCGDNLSYTLNTGTGELVISGTGAMEDGTAYYSTMPFYAYKDYIKKVVVEEGVTSIGDYGFFSCEELVSITLPDTLTKIGYGAFYNCVSLTSIVIPDAVEEIGDYAFEYDEALKTVTFSSSLKSIGEMAFYGCAALTSAILPNSLITLGYGAFWYCSSLSTLQLSNSMTSIGELAFYRCTALKSVTIPDSVTEIEDEAFWETGLTSITIPGTVKSIGSYAFADCDNLKKATIKEGVTSIGDSAFARCTSLSTVSLPNSLLDFGDFVFGATQYYEDLEADIIILSNGVLYEYNTGSSTSITIPSTVRAIAGGVFEENTTIKKVTLSSGLEVIGESAFSGCTALTSVTGSTALRQIGKSAFCDCTSLTTVSIPDTISAVGAYAFKNTPFLENQEDDMVIFGSVLYCYKGEDTEVMVPDGITTISDEAFAFQFLLESVELPDTLESIGTYAFLGCHSLKKLIIPSSVTDISSYSVGYYCNNGIEGTFYVQSGMVIVGESDSVAVAYAKENGIGYVISDTLSGPCGDNLTWSMDLETSTLTISGTGAFSDDASKDEDGYSNYMDIVQNVVVEEGVTTLGYSAFSYFENLESISLPSTLQSIGRDVFYQCRKLRTVDLPASVTNIDTSAFQSCTALQEVNVEDGNTVYTSVDGVLYDQAVTYIIFYPSGNPMETYVVPSTVTMLFNYDLTDARNIRCVVLPKSLTVCAGSAFRWSETLEKVIFLGDAPHTSKYSSSYTNLTFDQNVVIAYDSLASGWEELIADSSASDYVTWVDISGCVSGSTLQIGRSSDSLSVGGAMQLTATLNPELAALFVWSSSNTNIARVSGNGIVTGISAGIAVITCASADGAYTAAFTLTVTGTATDYDLPDGEVLSLEADMVGEPFISLQIPSEEWGGVYFLNNNVLYFYSLQTESYQRIQTFYGCEDAYVSGDLLYMLVSDTTVVVYDLAGRQIVHTQQVEDGYYATAVGADAKGRIYIAANESNNGVNHRVYLYSADGQLLSYMGSPTVVYGFFGFDEDTGYFFMEAYNNYYSWGYDHPGQGVTEGVVKNNCIERVDNSYYFLESGMILRELSCLMYLNQFYYYSHQDGAELLGDRYLVMRSVLHGSFTVMEVTEEGLSTVLELARDPIDYELDDDYTDTTSVGVRAVYNEANNSIILYDGNRTITEYDLSTGNAIATYRTSYYVYSMSWLGDSLVIVEKENDAYYMETVEWTQPTSLSVTAESSSMKVAQAQQLTTNVQMSYDVNCTWTSSDPSIASVTDSGRVVAWSAGKVTITASILGGKLTSSVTITVQASDVTGQASSVVTSTGKATNNISDNNYSATANVVNSYLMENSDGTISRIEYISGTGVLVETYTSGYELKSTKTITTELSYFGGFYAGENYNFLVFGKSNTSESDSTEVMRVVKYDKSWNRISQCSVYGARTYVPFDAGSLRMAETDGLLYIHTCHTMYADEDGLNHQANMTFVITESDMTVAQSYYDVLNISQAGYVSHSFNQFIQTDGTYVYRVDQGDGYPRAVAITKCSVDGAITNVDYTYALSIQGGTGENATGVSVGGFEISTDNLLIVGNSVDQSDEDTYDVNGQRNIFLSVTSKSLESSGIIWLTNYTSSSKITPRTPQLMKLTDDHFLVMWEEYNSGTGKIKVKALTIDGDGTVTSDVITMSARLSDCQPIVTSDGLVRWYASDGGTVAMYTLNPYELENVGNMNVFLIDITECTITLSKTSYTYDGTAKKPTVTVEYGTDPLTKNTDYTVTYSNNTNAGTATVTVKGKGDFTGSDKYTFTINKASQTVSVKTKGSTSIKAGATTTWTAQTTGNGTITYSTTASSSVATVNSKTGKVTAKGAGTVKVYAQAAATTNYKASSKKLIATIKIGLKTPTISSVKQSGSTVTVKWAKITGAKGYYIYRSTSKNGTYSKVKTITSGSTVSYKDTASKSNGKTYYYKVYAYSGSTKSSASAAKSVKYMKGTISSLTNTSSGITVNWSKVSNASGYYVYRKASTESKYTLVKTIGKASTVSYTDTKVKSKNGTTYTYYVQPYYKSGSTITKGAYATTKTVRMTAVSLSSVKNSSSKKMTVKWSKNTKATGYQIQYSTSSTFASGNKTVTVSGASSTSKVIGSLTKGKKYYVRIRTYKTVSKTKYYSAWSSKKSVKISK